MKTRTKSDLRSTICDLRFAIWDLGFHIVNRKSEIGNHLLPIGVGIVHVVDGIRPGRHQRVDVELMVLEIG
jgi:hypothetical protein